jgi:hypothetical protein
MRDLAPGFVMIVLIASALLTAPAAAVLLWLYHRSVRRGMTTGTVNSEPPLVSDKAATSRPALRISDRTGDSPFYREHSLRAAITVYVVAGLVFALLMAAIPAIEVQGDTWTWSSFLIRVMTLSAANFWPTVLAIVLVAATNRRERLSVVFGYFIVYALIEAGALAVSPKLTARQLVTSWLIHDTLPTILILTFLIRRLRAVGPLILTFMLIPVLGAWFTVSVLPDNAIFHSDAVFYPLLAASFVVFGFIASLPWRRLGVLYQRKIFSDQSLMLDSLFLYFAITQGLLSMNRYVWFGAPAAFLAYKVTTWAGFSYMRRRNSGPPAGMLLLLRVFRLGGRSERLFDALAKRWRRLGSISLIAGPDLLTAAVEPHEFLDFIGGKLSRRFVAGEEDLSKRIEALDAAPDPDGRYRVNQFFCRPDTWRITMRSLAQQASVILMDLRNFSSQSHGCMFELSEILRAIDLSRVVLMIDTTTDRPFLESTLQRLWQQVPPDSLNCAEAGATIRLFVVQAANAPQVRFLLRELLAAIEVTASLVSNYPTLKIRRASE